MSDPGVDEPSLVDAAAHVVRLLHGAGATMATAESLTGGWLGATVTAVPGASGVYRGGMIAYATELKHQLLGVDSALLARVGAVDAQVAASMAEGVRDRLGADYGVATTGVAGPDPQDGHPPGTVWVAIAAPGPTWVLDASVTDPVDRAAVRRSTVLTALTQLAVVLRRDREEPPTSRR